MSKKRAIMIVSSALIISMLLMAGCNGDPEVTETEGQITSESESVTDGKNESESVFSTQYTTESAT